MSAILQLPDGPAEVVLDARDRARWRSYYEARVRRLQRLLAIPDPQERSVRLTLDAQSCGDDFFYWLTNYGVMYNPKAASPSLREVPFIPWPGQVEYIEWLDRRTEAGLTCVTEKAREIGITWLVLHRLLHLWKFEREFSGIIGSRTEDLVDKTGDFDSLFEKLRKVERLHPPHLQSDFYTKHMLMKNRGNDSELVGEATNEEFGRGKRRRVAFIDEGAAVQPRIFTGTWMALESTVHSIWVVTNPKGRDHPLFETIQGLEDDAVRTLSWRLDPTRTEDWKTNKIQPVGRLTLEQFMQEYENVWSAITPGRIWDLRRDSVLFDENTAEFAAALEAMCRGHALQGWDFGSGPSNLVMIFALMEMVRGHRPRLWVWDERIWSATSWRDAAADTVELMAQFPRAHHIAFGDPAGRQRESDQSTWERNLRSGGVPIFCLPYEYNTRDKQEWMMKAVQAMMDDGLLRIHPRCRGLIESMQYWRRDIPDNTPMDHLSRPYIRPRKDVYSHACQALMYLVAGAIERFMALRSETETKAGRDAERASAPEILTPSAEIAAIMERLA